MSNPLTDKQIAEKWAEEIENEFTAVQCIYVGVPRTCNYMSPADFNHRMKELREAKTLSVKFITAAIGEATEAQRKEIERLNNCRDAHHKKMLWLMRGREKYRATIKQLLEAIKEKT